MKASVTFGVATLSSWAFAAPVVMLLSHAQNKPGASMVPSVSSTTQPERASSRVPFKIMVTEHAGIQEVLEGRPDNRPYTPSDDVTPSKALSSPRPLKTSYLLSLHRRPSSEEQASESYPSDSSIVREEVGANPRSSDPTIVELETEANIPVYRQIPCPLNNKHTHEVRNYADMAVVSVVLIFIALVAIIELWSPICQGARRLMYGEGAIRLEEDENEKAQLRQRYANFVLQPAPRPKSKLTVIVEQVEEK